MEKLKLPLNGKELIFEISDLAEQANGSVTARYGDTLVLATCVMAKEQKETANFFPLTVDYEEKYYAAGKIKGSRYVKRENRPSDEAICNARLIDRTVRPKFPKNFKHEVQVINTVLSWDAENDPDILSICASSLSLSLSDIPWSGPVAAVRVGRKENKFILNPSYGEREGNEMDIVFAGGFDGENFLINMIEGSFEESEESLIADAAKFATEYLKEICNFQKTIIEKFGKTKFAPQETTKDGGWENQIRRFLEPKLGKALFLKDKEERTKEMDKVKEELVFFLEDKFPENKKTNETLDFLEQEIDSIVHKNALEHEKRVDGRRLDEVRELQTEVGLLPRTHGSGLFSRGQTKALSILTLGAPGDQQLLEGMEIVGKKRFMHHYNFPPYSVGEIRPMRGPGRRDIGHGMLAEKALLPLIPGAEEFPYTIRVVSEIVSSNGSSSMASVSSSSLALMDAGVPIKTPAAGIAIGLMSDEKGNYKILTDIQGPEDHHGDMDLKVAGTKKGVTAIQMDVKIKGITEEILKKALEQGKKARWQILEKMEETIAKPRPELSPLAPRILTLQISPDKIREVIGPGGKIINEIIDQTGANIDIQDSGLIFVTAENESSAQKAIDWIKNIVREAKVGEIFQGRVKRILEFGAFVEILPNQEGLVHISQLAPYHVNKVEDVVKIGDLVSVKVISIDELGRINLSLKETRKNER